MYPCKNCPDRHLGCHDNCEKYRVACMEHHVLTDIIRKAKHDNCTGHSKKWYWGKFNDKK